MWASGNLRPSLFDTLASGQKVNHFPGSTELTHKDGLAAHVREQCAIYGSDYDIIPETYILPKDYSAAQTRIAQSGGLWISKPCAQSQGRGIFLVDHLG
jgi:tubulin polyglutamylase TTLL4